MSRPGPRVAVLIAAGGSGRRMGGAENKVLLPWRGVPLVVHAAAPFLAHPAVGRVGVIVRPGDEPALDAAFAAPGAPTGAAERLPWIPGGAERQESVYNGLTALEADPPDRVLVHDGARPWCSPALVERVLAALDGAAAVIPVLPVTDTVRRMADGRSEVVERTGLVRTQTPQGFHWDVLWEAHRRARAQGLEGTDDAQLVEAMGVPLATVAGEWRNVKITTPEDLESDGWVPTGGA